MYLLDLLGLLVAAVLSERVITLNLLDHLLHLLNLTIQLGLAHLGLLVEQLEVWSTVRTSKSVPEGGVLSVVVVEVQVVHGVAGGAVDDGRVGNILSVI